MECDPWECKGGRAHGQTGEMHSLGVLVKGKYHHINQRNLKSHMRCSTWIRYKDTKNMKASGRD